MAKVSLTRGKGIFIVDLFLIPIFILVIYSGLKLHIAGHGNDYAHDVWTYWAHFHIVLSIVSLIGVSLHIKAHWGWYKSFIKKGTKKKSRLTIGLSVLFLVLCFTGIALVLFVEGANSKVGLWHYRFGLVIIVLLLVHFVTRFRLLRKGLSWINKK